jgi:uncharacterized protein (TIGR00251 family)
VSEQRDPHPYLSVTNDGVVALFVHVQPGARRTEVVGRFGDALKIRLAVPAVDGRANRALTDFLAEVFSSPRRDIYIATGQTSRRKRVRLTHITPTAAAAAIEAHRR